ncbi:hypothetical protein GIB67_002495 [Kingdonia uniflora]|uniref:Uncharacterized protein n=1 Tax=Kingdonia uniflora TaxID=39325 RepID=A0A7J7LAY5_9MAGN|nr:hypothetical protein GIB67_002495 [Kingdonia uniflora]
MEMKEVVKNSSNNNHRVSSVKEDVTTTAVPSSDFVLQWGNRKRLRCMKLSRRNSSGTVNVERSRSRVNRGLYNNNDKDISIIRRHSSPPRPPQNRALRKSETITTMKGVETSNNYGTVITATNCVSPERKLGGEEKLAHDSKKGGTSASSDTAHDSKKGGGSSSGGTSSEPVIPVWLPKFVIALTNKEKEEDFMAIKGSKLPQRPKKRAKFVQRTLNLVSPGAWLCDLTLERYEVREKKISKKKPRGLKAMGTMESDSE